MAIQTANDDPSGGKRDVSDRDGIPHHDWNERERGETELQRLDRNFGEILQELRVAQTGVQILFAFLLTLAFTQRFTQISAFQHDLYIATLVLATFATGLLIAPVAYHRITFRRRMKPQLVSAANRMALGGLTFLMLALSSSLLFITDVVLDRGPALIVTAIGTLWLVTFWYVIPIVDVLRSGAPEDDHVREACERDSTDAR